MKILVLNSGSSSLKTCLYEIGAALPGHPPVPEWEATFEVDGGGGEIHVKNSRGAVRKSRVAPNNGDGALQRMLETLWSGDTSAIGSPAEIDVVGHRVVQGGQEYEEPTIVTADVRAAIRRLSDFAPLHNRAELAGIETVERLFGKVLQVAVFDTGFHRNLPLATAVYGGPYEWFEQGIRRYGFHGINHQYCAERAAQLLNKDLRVLKLVTCHLGNGCSLAAVRDGRSVDTTMGFTPLEGLMMGTRSGSVDPGILTYLMRRSHITGEQLDELLNRKSGLLGISGVSGDMRQVLAAMRDGHARAKLAFEMYVHRLQSCIGAMIAVLGGLMSWYSAPASGRIRRKFEPQRAAISDFWGLDWITRRIHSHLRIKIFRSHHLECVFLSCTPKRIGPSLDHVGNLQVRKQWLEDAIPFGRSRVSSSRRFLLGENSKR
jgi:acetate kinase